MKIELKGRTILLDDDSINIYNEKLWHISDTGYVVWRGIEYGVKKTVRLHRLVIGAKDNEIVDHINRNKLDNRLCNLRICSFKDNIHNSDRHEFAKGYYYDNRKNRWTVDFKRYGLKGIYVDTEQDAINYVNSVKLGIKPKKVMTRRKSIGMSKLTETNRNKIFTLSAEGISKRQIAKIIGVSESCVGRLINRVTWKGKTL